jgi:WD40 repeat protein
VALYDVAHKTLRVVARPSQVLAIASIFFSSDTTLWIGGAHTGANGVYRVTDLDHKPRVTVEFPGATGISADADGRRLVVSYQTSVEVFDGRTLQPATQIIPLGSSYITAVSSAPDGHTAVVGSSQGWRLVDLDGQQLIGPWTPGPVGSLAFLGADNTTVYTEATNGDGQIWDLAHANLQAAACALAGRNLTTQEWEKYLPWAGHEYATCAQYPLS